MVMMKPNLGVRTNIIGYRLVDSTIYENSTNNRSSKYSSLSKKVNNNKTK